MYLAIGNNGDFLALGTGYPSIVFPKNNMFFGISFH
jgi:hypothetical protein